MNIKKLLERYNLKTRKALYARLDKLGITLDKDERGHNYAAPEQIEQLDELEEHLQSTGGTLANFVPVTQTEIAQTEFLPEEPVNGGMEVLIRAHREADLFEIASQLQPKSPLWFHRELKEAAAEGWLLSTEEVQQLIGVKPTPKKGEDFYERGSWTFVKAGKIGTQTAWRVVRSQTE